MHVQEQEGDKKVIDYDEFKGRTEYLGTMGISSQLLSTNARTTDT